MSFAKPFRRPGRAALPLIAIAISACASGAVPEPAGAVLTQDGRGQAVLSDQLDASRWPSDPITVENASVSGDTLAISVNHGGGCARHSYQLVISRTWMESNPVQVPALLSHDAHGDTCKALLRRDLRFSLTPLANAYRAAYQQAHGTVSIRLAGWTSPLVYSF